MTLRRRLFICDPIMLHGSIWGWPSVLRKLMKHLSRLRGRSLQSTQRVSSMGFPVSYLVWLISYPRANFSPACHNRSAPHLSCGPGTRMILPRSSKKPGKSALSACGWAVVGCGYCKMVALHLCACHLWELCFESASCSLFGGWKACAPLQHRH